MRAKKVLLWLLRRRPITEIAHQQDIGIVTRPLQKSIGYFHFFLISRDRSLTRAAIPRIS
jgi:hypothetical protein